MVCLFVRLNACFINDDAKTFGKKNIFGWGERNVENGLFRYLSECQATDLLITARIRSITFIHIMGSSIIYMGFYPL